MKLVTIPGALDVMVQSYDEPRTGMCCMLIHSTDPSPLLTPPPPLSSPHPLPSPHPTPSPLLTPPPPHLPGVLNPSLVKVRPFSSGGSAVAGENLIREAQEFVPVEAFHPHTNYYIHLTYTHHLYLYPLSLKYDAQRNFAKVGD